MNKKQLEHFKTLLLEHRAKILNGGYHSKTEDLHISSDDLAEDGDLANHVINQQITLSVREREREKLMLINEALERIEDGTYGFCEDCDEEIGLKRLEKQPWASLCITHAEEREREEMIYRKVA
jgi:DnaK suppressor protein